MTYISNLEGGALTSVNIILGCVNPIRSEPNDVNNSSQKLAQELAQVYCPYATIFELVTHGQEICAGFQANFCTYVLTSNIRAT